MRSARRGSTDKLEILSAKTVRSFLAATLKKSNMYKDVTMSFVLSEIFYFCKELCAAYESVKRATSKAWHSLSELQAS